MSLWTQIVDEFTPPLLEVITKHVETVSELDDVQFIQRLVNELRRSGSLLLQTGATEQAKQALFAAVDKLESRLRLPQRGFRTLIGTSTICFKVAANILLSPFAFVEHIIGIVKVIREGHSHDRPVSLRRAFGVSLIIFATVASVVTVVRWSLDTGYRLPEFTVRAISVGLMLSAVTAALASLTIPKTFHFLQTSSLLLILVASSVIVLAKATVTQMLGSALPAWQGFSHLTLRVRRGSFFYIARCGRRQGDGRSWFVCSTNGALRCKRSCAFGAQSEIGSCCGCRSTVRDSFAARALSPTTARYG